MRSLVYGLVVTCFIFVGICQEPPPYHDDQANPYWPGLDSPKLITPQWVGEEGVEASILLSIDDMRDPAKYEAFCRPILDRLKKIDGRAPLTIFTNSVDPNDPRLQSWLTEGLSIEVHTIDHPCPLLARGDFAQAKKTVHDCIDLLDNIPNMSPVAYRMPCCDSMNSVSPRFFTEIFEPVTEFGKFLQIDSSVFNLFTPDDPELPAELIGGGRGRFNKYIPKLRGFVNYVENYPYPYIIGNRIWQFPSVIPSDWEAQNLHGVYQEETVADLKAAIDATVIKKGMFTLVFHPHGWIRNDQVVDLIDHAVKKHGKKVKFLNMREALDRLNKNLFADNPLRHPDSGRNPGVRLLDLDNDKMMDVLIDTATIQKTRLWVDGSWKEFSVPPPGLFGSLSESGTLGVAVYRRSTKENPGLALYHFNRTEGWIGEEGEWQTGGNLLRDLDGDGIGELITNIASGWIFKKGDKRWDRLPFTLPYRTSIRTEDRKDAGMRFVDVNGDGSDDIVFSNHERYSVHLWVSMESGWAVAGLSGNRGDYPEENEIPMIVREDGSNNGVWFKDNRMFVQNEHTAKDNTVVEQRSFQQLATALTKPEAVTGLEPTPPGSALETMRTHGRFEVQLVAAEPLIADPVDIAWGPDGRLWVVEMGDYPLGEDGKGKPGGRVRVLEDTRGDGIYDKSTVFLKDLLHPSGVMPWKDGVLVLAAPDLFYARDLNGDDVADSKEVLYDGFRKGNPQHLANGLAWGLDNWIYIANGDSGGEVRSVKTGKTASISGRDLRIRPETGELDPQSGMTQFSRPRDDWGNWFGCNNSSPLWHYVLHDHYLRRNPHVASPAPDIHITEPMVHPQVYPASKTIERFNDYHTENRITSACGAGIYRAHALGDDVYGNAFICEPVHNLVYRQVLTPDGYTFKARRADAEAQSEFLASTDNWFRPVTARTGPDGALYVVDMYRHVIEHPEWIPPEWEEKLDLRAGHDRGRIYRVVRRGSFRKTLPNLADITPAQLVPVLNSDSGELRDMAHQQLVSRGAGVTEVIDALEKLVLSGERPASRLQGLCALDGLGKLSNELLQKALADPSGHVRRHAVRLCESRAALLDSLPDPDSEEDVSVLLQLASTAGEFKGPRAGEILTSLLTRHSNSHWMRAAVMSSSTAHAEALTDMLVGLSPDKLNEQLPVLESMIELNKAVSRNELLPRLVAGVAPQLAKLGTASFAITSKLLEAGTSSGLDPVISLAASSAQDTSLEPSARAEAIALLAAAGKKDHLPYFESLLTFNTSTEVQLAAVNAIGSAGTSANAAQLLKRWAELAPAARRAVINICLGKQDWTRQLLDAAEGNATVLASLNSADSQRLSASANVTIRERAKELLARSPASAVAEQLKKLSSASALVGNRANGKALFTAVCSICHQLEDTGQPVGPDLASLTDRSFDAMLTAIVDPNATLEDKYVSYLVTTKGDELLLGSIASETGTTITLKLVDGSERAVLRQDLKSLASTGKSLMPEGLGGAMDPQQLADLISFIQTARPPRKEFAGNEPLLIAAGDNGRLGLLSSMGALYGPTIRFSTRYRQLENWRSPQDEVVWQVDVPTAGHYRVEVDASVDSGVPDNTFQIVAPAAKVTGDTPLTRNENDFRVREYGTIELSAGRQEISMRAAGPIKRSLLDLRGIYLSPVKSR